LFSPHLSNLKGHKNGENFGEGEIEPKGAEKHPR